MTGEHAPAPTPTSPGTPSADRPVVAAVHDDRTGEIVLLAAALAARTSRPLILANACDETAPGGPSRAAGVRSWLETVEVPGVDPGAVERLVIPAIDPVLAMEQLVAARGAALLVTGGDLTGDVAARLAAGAPCPVAVLPRGAVPRPLRSLAVAFDGSAEAGEAYAEAIALAAARGLSIELLAVAPAGDRVAVPFHALGSGEERARELETIVREAVAAAPVDLTVTGRVLRGRTAHELVAASFDADLLLCGTHGRGRIGRLMLGSVSTALMRFGDCPVLVVPPRTATPAARPGRAHATARG